MTKTKNATVQTYLERKRKNTWCKMTQPRHPTKNIIWGMNERKGKLTYCKHHAAKTTCKSKLTHCKMICPRQPARDNTQDTNANAKKWKHTRKKEQKQRRPSAKSGQCSQQQTPRWRQGLKAHTHRKIIQTWHKQWQVDLPNHQRTIVWETNNNRVN